VRACGAWGVYGETFRVLPPAANSWSCRTDYALPGNLRGLKLVACCFRPPSCRVGPPPSLLGVATPWGNSRHPTRFTEHVSSRTLFCRSYVSDPGCDKPLSKNRGQSVRRDLLDSVWVGEAIRELTDITVSTDWAPKLNRRSGWVHFGSGLTRDPREGQEFTRATQSSILELSCRQRRECASRGSRRLLPLAAMLDDNGGSSPDVQLHTVADRPMVSSCQEGQFISYTRPFHYERWKRLSG